MQTQFNTKKEMLQEIIDAQIQAAQREHTSFKSFFCLKHSEIPAERKYEQKKENFPSEACTNVFLGLLNYVTLVFITVY